MKSIEAINNIAFERKPPKNRANAERHRLARLIKAINSGKDYKPKVYETPEERRLSRARYKREARARAGAKPKRMYDSHVKAWAKFMAKPPPRHDAHVRAFKADVARMARWRVENDPAYRINMRMRVQIRKALKGGKAGRRWESIVGYTVHELMAHLSKALPKGMTFERAMDEGWHIDHIVPKSAFDVTNEEELRKAWALPNLRLLPGSENRAKGPRHVFLL